ncbi:hypothetical protein NEF87_000350 [Candidatus Lokiarchaeum ossiferum]|uniref:Uncharacterized protein n=1 Tax=Candidatus Lokiarchaeum ossiferum TaxID=2951803 RepID=A0ABY6HKL3_9ARCH|nr:hypothetical protein NEF87_000350 [Candidatus Lokiarchaeum sp. B-35]
MSSMTFLFVVLVLIGIAASSLNIYHFLKRRSESNEDSKKIQTYFIIYHMFFIIAIIFLFISDFADESFTSYSLVIAITMSSSLLAATFAIQAHLEYNIKIARIIVLSGFTLGLILMMIEIITDIEFQIIILIINGIITVISIGFLIYYLIKAPLSPLFGFLISQILTIIFHSSGILNENGRALLYIILSIIMYLGYKNKYSFIEKIKK